MSQCHLLLGPVQLKCFLPSLASLVHWGINNTNRLDAANNKWFYIFYLFRLGSHCLLVNVNLTSLKVTVITTSFFWIISKLFPKTSAWLQKSGVAILNFDSQSSQWHAAQR